MRFRSRRSLHPYLPAVALRAYYTAGKHRIFWDIRQNRFALLLNGSRAPRTIKRNFTQQIVFEYFD
ncbi:MAG: hypothetical protein A3J93_04085 [Candidatus Magasanikbacteria bacterium RIFOXYC2_FULL_42_28]|uniref:Uncharacterized protein n=1 Tax=Candidatus Magasanikbacteria bacterium RIFOXYC2_FULL_42_28 TaxID=1798704 RepID=A0A1F6NX71_9BACT|nr:MAG: hypothetical protein A3J93_04085 [Candidatus Magasanikbacteria bacterium RIFOXYC2_FULL_42_28]